jgi:hypothetical protein
MEIEDVMVVYGFLRLFSCHRPESAETIFAKVNKKGVIAAKQRQNSIN